MHISIIDPQNAGGYVANGKLIQQQFNLQVVRENQYMYRQI